MKKQQFSILMGSMFALAVSAQTNWKVDNSHSKIGFSVTHMMVGETEGKFKLYEGKVSSTSETDFKIGRAHV